MWSVALPDVLGGGGKEGGESELVDSERVWWSFPQGDEELFIDFMEGECRQLIDGLHDRGCSMEAIYRDFCGVVFKDLEKRSRK